MSRTFAKYINTFVDEKGLDRETVFAVEGPSGTNWIPLEVVIEHMLIAPAHEQAMLEKMLTRIDFLNGNVMQYFKQLARAIAK